MQTTRRTFLKTTGLSASALVLGVGLGEANAETVVKLAPGASFSLNAFVQITSDGKITLKALMPDMGQGTYQALPAILAEELNVPLSAVTIEFTKGETSFGDQTAGGSSSVRSNYAKLRKTGAAAREMLVKAASDQWQVATEECYADGGKVFHKPSGKRLSYGELVEAAAKLEVPKEPKLKDEKDFTILGKPMPKPDVPWKVTGRPIFGMDVTVPGMLYASVQHGPVVGSTVKAFDATAAKAVKGVRDVLRVDRRLGDRLTPNAGVAVVADNYWAATQGRKKLNIDWDTKGYETTSSEKMAARYRALAQQEGVSEKAWGDFGKAFADAPTKLDAAYETPFLSHSPMETAERDRLGAGRQNRGVGLDSGAGFDRGRFAQTPRRTEGKHQSERLLFGRRLRAAALPRRGHRSGDVVEKPRQTRESGLESRRRHHAGAVSPADVFVFQSRSSTRRASPWRFSTKSCRRASWTTSTSTTGPNPPTR